MLPLPLLPQELRTHDSPSAKTQPLVPKNMACAAWHRLLDSPVFRPRSTRCLQPCYRKRCVPNRGKSPLQAAKMQNSDASTAQSNPMPSVPFPQDFLRGDSESSPEKAWPELRLR